MWKRVSHRPDRQSSFGTPSITTLATTDKPLPNPTTNLNSGEFSISSRPAFGTRATGDVLKGLPDLPFDHLEITPGGKLSSVPTTSSPYSQSSSEADDLMTPTTSQQPVSASPFIEDVSPPDSPRANGLGSGHSRKPSYNVSPISTDNPSPFSNRSSPLKSPKYSSNLPVPRKNLKKFWKLPDKTNPTSPDNDSTTVRWDEYSGEPTDSDRGKPPSTTPGAVKLHEDPTPGRLNPQNFGISTHISGGTIARKRVGSREVSDAPVKQRPEWKGAGGRHAIVRMPSDKPLPEGQSPSWSPGQAKKQQMEDEHRAEQEMHERQRLESERQEQERLAQEHKQRQMAEEERLENERSQQESMVQETLENARQEQQRRETDREESRRQLAERAEQIRLDKVRDEQERRRRERVVQARRERDLAQQEDRKRKEMAQKSQTEKQDIDSLPKAEEIPCQVDTSRLIPGASPRPEQPSIRLDTNNLDAPQHSVIQRQESPNESASSSTLHSHRTGSLSADDRRSPLARNPSKEEMKDRKEQPLPDLPKDVSLAGAATSGQPINQPHRWEPRTSSLPQDERSMHDPDAIESRFRDNIQNMSLSDGPKSRFSATTVATTAYNDSPPQTPQVKGDLSAVSPGSTPDSILNRRRPVPPANFGRATTRKPTPSEAAIESSESGPNNISKTLPKAPEGVPKVSQVQTLQAKQDALRRRRRNIETVIRELTDVVQPSSLAYDKASRAEIKKTVDQLNKELAEVIKDEHETGLKLHRAWKRHEDFADFEPTSIWVRRVTH